MDEYSMNELLFSKIESIEDASQKVIFNEPTKIFCMKSKFKEEYTSQEESAVIVAEVPFKMKHTQEFGIELYYDSFGYDLEVQIETLLHFDNKLNKNS